MKLARLVVLGLLAASLALASCGRKGEPERPGETTEKATKKATE